MFSTSLKELLPQVITSWQVWVTILALVLYMYLIGYVSRTHYRPRVSKAKPKKRKAKAAVAAPQDDSGGGAG